MSGEHKSPQTQSRNSSKWRSNLYQVQPNSYMLLSRTFGQTSAHLYRGFPALPIPVQLSNIYRHRQTNTLTWCCYTRTCDSCWTTARNPLHTHTQTHTHTRTHTVSVQFLIMSIIWLLHIQPVTPHACGARKKALGRAVYDKFVNVYSWNSPARWRRGTRVASAVDPVPFLNRMTFSKSAIMHRFPNFYTLRVDIFQNFPPSSLRMTPMNHDTFHENRSAHFSEIRNTDTQTDLATLYI